MTAGNIFVKCHLYTCNILCSRKLWNIYHGENKTIDCFGLSRLAPRNSIISRSPGGWWPIIKDLCILNTLYIYQKVPKNKNWDKSLQLDCNIRSISGLTLWIIQMHVLIQPLSLPVWSVANQFWQVCQNAQLPSWKLYKTIQPGQCLTSTKSLHHPSPYPTALAPHWAEDSLQDSAPHVEIPTRPIKHLHAYVLQGAV